MVELLETHGAMIWSGGYMKKVENSCRTRRNPRLGNIERQGIRRLSFVSSGRNSRQRGMQQTTREKGQSLGWQWQSCRDVAAAYLGMAAPLASF
jgi:hypothetical protein